MLVCPIYVLAYFAPLTRKKVCSRLFFPNDEHLQVANWQIDTDTLIANIKAQRHKFPQWHKDDHKKGKLNK